MPGFDPGPDAERLLEQLRARLRHRRSVRGARGLAAVIALGLLAVWLLHPPLPGGENRAPAVFPTGSLTDLPNLLRHNEYRRTDAALRDRLALRRYVIEAVGQASGPAVGGSLTPRVVLGGGGMPFTAEDFTLPCEYPFDPSRTDAGLRRLRAIGAATHRTVTVAIAPDKSSVLSDALGRRGPALLRCAAAVRAATEKAWPAHTSAPVLTVWGPMAAARQQNPDGLFQFGDTHWTTRGALVFGRALIAQLVDQGEAPPQLRGRPTGEHAYDERTPGDLYRMSGQERKDTVPVWTVHRPGVTVTTKVTPTPSGRGLITYTARRDHGHADTSMISGRTLVINDSFFSRAELQLAPFFSTLTVMHWDDFLLAVRAGTLPDFDRLVIESVQRGWPQRARWLQPGQPVHEALARALGAGR